MGVSVRYTIHSYSIWPNDALYVEALFGSSAFRAYCRPLGNVWSAASPQAKCEDVTGWSAQMYSAFVGVNHSWPGWNALRSFPITISVLRDYFRVRVLRAPGSTVVPSPHSPADLARNHVLRSSRQTVAGSSGCSYIGQHGRPILFILCEHGPRYACQLIR